MTGKTLEQARTPPRMAPETAPKTRMAPRDPPRREKRMATPARLLPRRDPRRAALRDNRSNRATASKPESRRPGSRTARIPGNLDNRAQNRTSLHPIRERIPANLKTLPTQPILTLSHRRPLLRRPTRGYLNIFPNNCLYYSSSSCTRSSY